MTGQQIDRDRLRVLAENATEGPWEVDYMGDLVSVPEREKDRYGGHIFIGTATGDASSATEDAEFIAAARTAVPALLDMLDQAEAERDRAQAALDRVRELHQPCNHDAPCRGDCAECGQHMPCDTIRALDGDQ